MICNHHVRATSYENHLTGWRDYFLLGAGLAGVGVGAGFWGGVAGRSLFCVLESSPDRVCFSGVFAIFDAYTSIMAQSNLDSLAHLEDAVLREVVREAERRLDAQLATATAADQRATAWAAILVTAAVAITGASAALLVNGKNLLLAAVGIVVAALLGISLMRAIDVFRPKDWHFPGNSPRNWVPELWQCHGTGQPCNLRQATIEQAASLDEQIEDNAEAAKWAGEQLKFSMDLALWAVALGVVAVGMILLAHLVGVPM